MTPDDMEERLGRILGLGTMFSTVGFAAGLAFWLIAGDRPFVDRLLNSAIVVLIVTPVARVVASTVMFTVQRDRHMVLMTTLVLLSLALSVAVAIRR